MQDRNELNIYDRTVYTIGDTSLLDGPMVVVTGARRATPYGIALAEMCGRVVAELGLTLMSTLSLGCSVVAARAAKKAGGKVVAAMATAPDVLYPNSSKDIYEKADLIISAAKWGEQPKPHRFVERDNLIAMMADTIIACEVGMRSGVFKMIEDFSLCPDGSYCEKHDTEPLSLAFPGSIFSQTSMGCNWLIMHCLANIVCDEQGLDKTLRRRFGIPEHGVWDGVPAPQDELLKALAANPMRPDELAKAFDKHPLDMLRKLAAYEADGRVERLPDGRYSLSKTEYIR